MIRNGFEQIIFKMDRHGNGERIVLEKVFDHESSRPSFRGFDMKLFTGKFCSNAKYIHTYSKTFYAKKSLTMYVLVPI